MTTARERIAANFESRFLRGYVSGKLGSDPVYEAVERRLPDLPLLDVGCGVGLLAFYLRECGFTAPIVGVDHDAKKIAAANRIAARYNGVSFFVADAREPLDFHGSVALLDLLHYFDDATQARILRNVAAAVAPGGVAVIREGVRDGSWRYRATFVQESFSRAIGWLKAERLNFPTHATIAEAFAGFETEMLPLWGRTPFNNYLFVFRRPGSGTTNE